MFGTMCYHVYHAVVSFVFNLVEKFIVRTVVMYHLHNFWK